MTNELTALARDAISELYDLFRDLDWRIASFDKKIDRIFLESEPCRRIATIKGVGPKTATAIMRPSAMDPSSKRKASCCLDRAGPAPVLRRRSEGPDGHI